MSRTVRVTSLGSLSFYTIRTEKLMSWALLVKYGGFLTRISSPNEALACSSTFIELPKGDKTAIISLYSVKMDIVVTLSSDGMEAWPRPY